MSIVKMNEIKKVCDEILLSSVSLNKCISLTGAIVAAVLLSTTPAYAIKKCKDANGKWHYGDVAACENAKVTTLSNQGFVKDELEAPKTKEELMEEELYRAEVEAEDKRLELIESEKSRVLSIYETEDDIDRQLENQLYAVDSNIAVHKSYIENLQEVMAYESKVLAKTQHPVSKAKIEKKISTAQNKYNQYSQKMSELEAQREVVIEKFAKEKELYRELTQEQKTAS